MAVGATPRRKTPPIRLIRREASRIDKALGLPPPYDLGVPAKHFRGLQLRLRAMWRRLGRVGSPEHRWTRGSLSVWDSTNAILARKARAEDANAIIALVSRDPRYLSDDLIVAQVFAWKMAAISGKEKRPGPTKAKRKQVGEDAEDNLKALGQAISTPTDNNNVAHIDPDVLLEVYQNAKRRTAAAATQLKGLRNPKVVVRRVADETGLVPKEVEQLLGPRTSPDTVAKRVVGRCFNLKYERIRKLISQAESA